MPSRYEYHNPLIKKKKRTTSKMILWVMVLIVVVILAYSMYEMHRLDDISQIYALIGIPATLCPIIWAYYEKSKAENTKGGIVYDAALNNEEAKG